MLVGSADGITCASDREVAEKISKEASKEISAKHTARFLWGQFRGLSDFYEAQVGAERQQAAADRARAELQSTAPESAAQQGKRCELLAACRASSSSQVMEHLLK